VAPAKKGIPQLRKLFNATTLKEYANLMVPICLSATYHVVLLDWPLKIIYHALCVLPLKFSFRPRSIVSIAI